MASLGLDLSHPFIQDTDSYISESLEDLESDVDYSCSLYKHLPRSCEVSALRRQCGLTQPAKGNFNQKLLLYFTQRVVTAAFSFLLSHSVKQANLIVFFTVCISYLCIKYILL